MKSIKSLHFLKKSLYSALVFFGTLVVLSVGYSLVGNLSATDKVGSGSGLTATSWNKIVDGILDLDTRLSNLSFTGGSVGIGVSPSAKLHVRESGLFTNQWTDAGLSYVPVKPILTVTTSGNGTASPSFATNAIFKVGIGGADTGNVTTEWLRVNLNGNIGIGTPSPINKLEIDGGTSAVIARISSTNTSTSAAGLIISNSSKTAFNDGLQIIHGAGVTKFNDLAGTNVMSLDLTNSRVGIGTPNPTQKLDVNGLIGIHSTTTTSLIGNIRMENDLFKIVTPSQKQWDFRDNGTVWFYNGSIWTQKL